MTSIEAGPPGLPYQTPLSYRTPLRAAQNQHQNQGGLGLPTGGLPSTGGDLARANLMNQFNPTANNKYREWKKRTA
jgi:hypothetical protein